MEQPKYSWSPAVTALKDYPMEVYSGHLIVGDNLKGAYCYLPFNTTIENGLDQSTDTSNDMYSPPRFLDISWYSFTEKKTYTGIFDLNYQLIDDLLKKENLELAGFDDEDRNLYFNIDHTAKIVKVGLLPGGVVRIWVGNRKGYYEVGRYQAKEDKTIDWKDVYPDVANMEEVADAYTKDLPQEIKNQMAEHRIPFGSWERLFKRYNLLIKTQTTDKIEVMNIWYANAEQEETLYIADEKDIRKQQGIPVKINLIWRRDDGQRIVAELVFDQEKMLDLFKNISEREDLTLTIKVDKTADLDVQGKGLLLELQSPEKSIDLKPYIKEQEMYRSSTQFPASAPHKTVVVPVYDYE